MAKEKTGIVKEYKADEIVVIWQPDYCEHAGYCVRMLPEVYQMNERPWCKPKNATTEELIEQINKCPTDALTYRYLNEEEKK